MACLLTCQSPDILKMDVVDIAVAGTACCFVAMAAARILNRNAPIV